jgi:hypothetical protein
VPGTYRSSGFEPKYVVTVPSGWSYDQISTGKYANGLSTKPNPGGHFIAWALCEPKASVTDTVARISALPNLSVASVTETTLGGVSAKRIDVTASANVIFCASQTAPPVETYFDPGDRGQIYVVAPEGVTVLVAVLSPAADFTAFAAEAQPVLDSITWGW